MPHWARLDPVLKRTHSAWHNARQRCQNPRCSDYPNYGGRGIRMCERWQKFENFLEDMGVAPPGLSIDRIKNDGDYEPTNCRWSTAKEQGSNRRTTVFVEYGFAVLTVSEWAELYGMKANVLHGRLKHGWSIAEALNTPVGNDTRRSKCAS